MVDIYIVSGIKEMAYNYTESNNYTLNPREENDLTTLKYKRKYKYMKKAIKSLVFMNAALCDQVSEMQEKILIVKEERRFLLKKLYHFQAVSEADNQVQLPKNISSALNSPSSHVEITSSGKKVHGKRKSADMIEHWKGNQKVKKTSLNKIKKIVQPIPLDFTGRPVFPIVLGGLTVHSLGEVVSDRPDYHTEDFIFPVGFCSTRVYGSLVDPERKCLYTCKVVDGGLSPRFEIVADSDPNAPLVGSSASECHSLLLRRINQAVGIDVVNTQGRGPDFFGFSHPTIQNLIQSSPGTRKCASYKWSKFEVNRTGEPPVEENDASLSFEALQRCIGFSKTVVKTEPSEQLLRESSATLRDLLMS